MAAILTYHSLDASGSPISVTPGLFRRQMEWLAASGIPVVSLRQVLARPGSVAITFDDAFANLLDHAIPVLVRYRLPATVFAVTAYTGLTNSWPGQPSFIPRLPLMGWQDLRALAASGVTLGAHTVNHLDLTTLHDAAQLREIVLCRRELEHRAGVAVGEFAYPYGASNQALRRRIRSHFQFACGTALRFLDSADDPADLPRIDGYYLRQFPIERLFSGMGRCYFAGRRILRNIRALAS